MEAQGPDLRAGSIADAVARAQVHAPTRGNRKLESFLELLRPFGLKELARTGRIAMLRGPSAQRVELEEAAAVRAVGR